MVKVINEGDDPFPEVELGHRTVRSARYWNFNNVQVSIVASIRKGVDWAAYIGATHDAWTEGETIEWTLKLGVKLDAKDAGHFFPELMALELPYRH